MSHSTDMRLTSLQLQACSSMSPLLPPYYCTYYGNFVPAKALGSQGSWARKDCSAEQDLLPETQPICPAEAATNCRKLHGSATASLLWKCGVKHLVAERALYQICLHAVLGSFASSYKSVWKAWFSGHWRIQQISLQTFGYPMTWFFQLKADLATGLWQKAVPQHSQADTL